MSIVVNLPAELENAIAAEAAKAGMTVSDYVAVRGGMPNGPRERWSRAKGTQLFSMTLMAIAGA